MQIGSVGALPNSLATLQTPRNEAAETGRDADHDGDEGKQVTATATSSTQTSGQTSSINILA